MKPKITVTCSDCGRRMVIDPSKYGLRCSDVFPRFGLSAKSPCIGTLLLTSDDINDAIRNMYAVALAVQTGKVRPDSELFDAVLDDFGHWAEGEQTPQQMGWVGQNGLP